VFIFPVWLQNTHETDVIRIQVEIFWAVTPYCVIMR